MENSIQSNDNKLNKELVKLLINLKIKSSHNFLKENNSESNFINILKKNYNYDNETINKLFINNDKYYLREKKKNTIHITIKNKKK